MLTGWFASRLDTLTNPLLDQSTLGFRILLPSDKWTTTCSLVAPDASVRLTWSDVGGSISRVTGNVALQPTETRFAPSGETKPNISWC